MAHLGQRPAWCAHWQALHGQNVPRAGRCVVACWHCSRGLGQGLVYGAPFLSLSMHLFFVSVLDSLSRSRALPIRCVTVFAFALALCVCVCARARMHACECMSGRASLVTGRAVQVVFHDNDVHKFDLRELTACKDNVRRPLSFSPWPVFPCSFALTSFPCTHTHPLIHTHTLSLSLSPACAPGPGFWRVWS